MFKNSQVSPQGLNQDVNQYQACPSIQTVKRLIEKSPNKSWMGFEHDILAEMGVAGYTSQQVAADIAAYEGLLNKCDGIRHQARRIRGVPYHLFYVVPTILVQETDLSGIVPNSAKPR